MACGPWLFWETRRGVARSRGHVIKSNVEARYGVDPSTSHFPLPHITTYTPSSCYAPTMEIDFFAKVTARLVQPPKPKPRLTAFWEACLEWQDPWESPSPSPSPSLSPLQPPAILTTTTPHTAEKKRKRDQAPTQESTPASSVKRPCLSLPKPDAPSAEPPKPSDELPTPKSIPSPAASSSRHDTMIDISPSSVLIGRYALRKTAARTQALGCAQSPQPARRRIRRIQKKTTRTSHVA